MFDRDRVLEEFDKEMATTSQVLKQVPADRLDWKPHEKSMPLGRLALHLARLPSWIPAAVKEGHLDLEETGDADESDPPPGPRDILEIFDGNVEAARKALRKASEGSMDDAWTLRTGDHEVFTAPRWAVLRLTILNHMIHHRAQLGIYLRLLDLTVPQSYGPTADRPT